MFPSNIDTARENSLTSLDKWLLVCKNIEMKDLFKQIRCTTNNIWNLQKFLFKENWGASAIFVVFKYSVARGINLLEVYVLVRNINDWKSGTKKINKRLKLHFKFEKPW